MVKKNKKLTMKAKFIEFIERIGFSKNCVYKPERRAVIKKVVRGSALLTLETKIGFLAFLSNFEKARAGMIPFAFFKMSSQNFGDIWSWGDNTDGHLGNNSVTNESSPVLVPGNWKKIVAGVGHTVAIRSDNTLWAWGDNGRGELGQNDTINRSSPVQIAGTWKSCAAGYRSSLAIKPDGNYVELGNKWIR